MSGNIRHLTWKSGLEHKLCSSLFVTCVCQDVDRFVVEVCKAASGIRKILKSWFVLLIFPSQTSEGNIQLRGRPRDL